MTALDASRLKEEVRGYWDRQACGTEFARSPKHSRAYYDEIEEHRYAIEPEIFSFAQFTRFHGRRVLEVGVGSGTDFLQWVRAGARASGIDLTPQGVEHVRQRLEVYGLRAEEVRVADCEALPFEDDSFDLVYSWGVIHHTPDTRQALREIVRVCRPGGSCKIMVYNRHSLVAYRLWLTYALLRGRPWRSLAWCVYHHMESIGTQAFTADEVGAMLRGLPVGNVRIRPLLTSYDLLGHRGRLFQRAARLASLLLGVDRAGWFLTVEFDKRPA